MYLERAFWTCRAAKKPTTCFTPFHLVYSEECVMLVNVMLPSLQFLLKHGLNEGEKMKERMISLHILLMDREEAIKYYEDMSKRRLNAFNNKLKSKDIKKGMLVMRYNNALDTTFQTKFKVR